MTQIVHDSSPSKMKESIRLVVQLKELRSYMQRMVKNGDSLGEMAARSVITKEHREAFLHRRHSFWAR